MAARDGRDRVPWPQSSTRAVRDTTAAGSSVDRPLHRTICGRPRTICAHAERSAASPVLDDVDRAILEALAEDARIPNDAAGRARRHRAVDVPRARARAARARRAARLPRRGRPRRARPPAAGDDRRAPGRPRRASRSTTFTAHVRGLAGVLIVFHLAGVTDYLVWVAAARRAGPARVRRRPPGDRPAVAHAETSLIYEHQRGPGIWGAGRARPRAARAWPRGRGRRRPRRRARGRRRSRGGRGRRRARRPRRRRARAAARRRGAGSARRLGQHAAQEAVPSGPAVVGPRRLERERVALQEPQLGRRHVGHDADDDVDAALQPARQRGEEVAGEGLHAVRRRAGDRARVESDATTRRPGARAASDAAIAPAPVQRSIAAPASGRRSAARSASGSLCQRGT